MENVHDIEEVNTNSEKIKSKLKSGVNLVRDKFKSRIRLVSNAYQRNIRQALSHTTSAG